MPPATNVTNPFSPAHLRNFIKTTPLSCHPTCPTCPELHTSCCNQLNDINYGHLPEQGPDQTVQLSGSPTKCERHKARTCQFHHACHQLSSESEEEHDDRERVPTLRPGQYDGTTPWREFLLRFESCSEANYWSEKTMAVQLKFCLVGTAGELSTKPPDPHSGTTATWWRRWRWQRALLRSMQLQWLLN